MAGDIVFYSEHFCADQTIIIQERSHTQTASWQPCLKFRSSQRRICLCLLERGWVDFGIVDTSCSWLVLHSQQSQSVSSSSPRHHPRGRRNWRAIKEALKRGNCQHDCLRFFNSEGMEVQIWVQWGQSEQLWKYSSLCLVCYNEQEIGRVVSEAKTVVFFSTDKR